MMTLRSDQNKTHVEHLPRDPDGVTTAQKVFDTRCVDARGSESVRHLDALVAAKIARRDALSVREQVTPLLCTCHDSEAV